MVKYGCYIIKDEFFKKFNDPFLKGNKNENRPHYCCFPDKDNANLFWVIPMSHKSDKYEKIIEKKALQNKPCDIIHIIEIGGNKSAMLIQDMFPITEEYIDRPYTIKGIHLVIKSKKYIEALDKKSINIYRLIHRRVKINPTQPDVLSIKFKLLQELEQKGTSEANNTELHNN